MNAGELATRLSADDVVFLALTVDWMAGKIELSLTNEEIERAEALWDLVDGEDGAEAEELPA